MEQQDEAAYSAFVDANWRSMVRAAVFLGARPADAEDVAQAALIRCYAGWAKVTGADNRDAYVYRMLLNCLRDQQRTAWWRLRAPAPAEHHLDHAVSVGDASERVGLADAVHRALGGLSSAQRDVVVLRYFVQLTEAQTAATLGISPGTVKSRLSRSLARLSADRHILDLAPDRAAGRTSERTSDRPSDRTGGMP
ncbi:MAG: SigE family RNA polymerase sigma factor [Nocardioides sp.]|uniref:SigE family RNA polymerase sigma factor n=1 Tax=Nocardioides sp. TaxID=35761 RepID=UPI0039E2228E